MAEIEPKVNETRAMAEKEQTSVQKMDVETQALNDAAEDGTSKRPREEGDKLKDEDNGDATKKPKVANAVEEEEEPEKFEEKKVGSDPVNVGPKSFGSSAEMFDYFYKLLHSWTPNLNLNKYEHMLLLDLLKKGHSEPERKIGTGIRAFQIRFHPLFKSRCFFVVREDDSVDDFSFRKCVDQIHPLPENMQIKHHANKDFHRGGKGGGGGGRGGRYGHGRGRGKSRY